MSAELIAEITSPDEFADKARCWLDGVLAEIFPGLLAGLRERPVTRDVPIPREDIDLPWGQPGHVLGTLTTYRKHPAFGGREVLYSDRAWQRFLSGLGGYPFAARIAINELDSRGFPVHDGAASVAVVRDLYAPEWVSFSFYADAADTAWPGSAETQDGWAGFVRDQAMATGACAGTMTDDIGPGQTALQRTTLNPAPISESRSALRGYAWITIVAAELAARLGGLHSLQESGAFYEVSALPDGAIWLRATPSINEFTGDRVQRVFEVLAPVLITGVAEFRWNESYRIVEGADAADYH